MKNNNFKALALLTIITLGLALPMMAQSDGFFRYNEDIYGDRATASGSLTNQTFGQDPGTSVTGGITNQQFGVPVGSGLLIMVAAGAGYAVVRRRRSMRKAGTMLLALAMVLTFTQCKKRIENVTPSNNGGTFITLNIGNDAKHHVVTQGQPWPNGDLGTIEWEEEDFIFVISGQNPVGVLQYHEDINGFSGIIGPGNIFDLPFSPVEGEPLNFVFTGGFLPEDDWTIDISNQLDDLAVLSCGVSDETYPSAGNVYNSVLENKCALVKFTLSTATTEAVRVSNMVTTAQMVVTANGVDIRPTSTTGNILLRQNDSDKPEERWAVLLPQSAVSNASVLIRDGLYQNAVNVPAVSINDLKYATIDLEHATYTKCEPYFSISGSKIVQFAPGNLQYKAAGTGAGYRFAEHQWDYVGGTDNDGDWGNVYEGGVKCSNNLIADDYTGWIDLFGWGTGSNPTLSTIDTYDDPAAGTTQETTIYDPYDEWGKYIDDGKWYTLSKSEWECVISNKTALAIRENKIAAATVHNVCGVVLLPDYFDLPDDCSFTLPTLDPTNPYDNIYNYMDQYTLNVYTDAQWGLMEEAGAIFLPASGYRSSGTAYMMDATYKFKAYWSTSDKGAKTCFALMAKNAMWVDDFFRCQGMSVRLVHNYEF